MERTGKSKCNEKPGCPDYCDDFEDYYDDNENQPLTACAQIRGGPLAPKLKGEVVFEQCDNGVWVTVEVCGLPRYRPAQNGQPQIGPHGFHIHENCTCKVGDPCDPFTAAGSHWNPTNQPHGNHAGDFPALFSNHGVAMMGFFTDKFCIEDIIGKTIIIHQSPDDYQTQPAGNSGKRLACGVIRASCPEDC